MSTRNFPSHFGLIDIGRVPVVSKLVDLILTKRIITGKQRRDLATLQSNQDAWRELLKIVEKSNCISSFHEVLLQTEYKDIVAVPKIPDNPKRKKSLFHFYVV